MKIKKLIESLPEIYQPIFGYKEYNETSRDCLDRLEEICRVISSLRHDNSSNQRLKILDLGCAQGYFSLSLAALGHDVTGVDFLEENINVCNYLASEHSCFDIKFFQADAIEYINGIQENQYDIVLGFSLFHHLIAERGLPFVQNLLGTLAKRTKIGFFELAVKDEPVYWAEALPEDDRLVLAKYSFTKLISKFDTHLSNISRPMYFASNYYTLDSYGVDSFDEMLVQSHKFEYGAHYSSRRYFLDKKYIMKVFDKERADKLDVNVTELSNEINQLEFLNSQGFDDLKCISFEEDADRMYLKRTIHHGQLLSDIIENLNQDEKWIVFESVLIQLKELEKLGLYISDLRPWNVIVNNDFEGKLIDYGSISNEMNDCSNTSSIFASFIIFVIELFSGKVNVPDPVRTFKNNLEDVPPRIYYSLEKNFINHNSPKLFSHIKQDIEHTGYSNEIISETNLLSFFIEEIRLVSNTYQHCLKDIEKQYVEKISKGRQLEDRICESENELNLAMRKITELESELKISSRKITELENELELSSIKVIELEHNENIERKRYEKISNELCLFKERKSIKLIDLVTRLFRKFR